MDLYLVLQYILHWFHPWEMNNVSSITLPLPHGVWGGWLGEGNGVRVMVLQVPPQHNLTFEDQ